MIYDCFSFNNELDLLEIRLNHHSSFVDKFVLTECPWTYSGKEKPLYYDQVKDSPPFSKFRDKIVHNIYKTPPGNKKNWPYEHDQRNSIRSLPFDNDNDLIIYADCDEIIRDAQVIKDAYNAIDENIITLDMTLCWYYFNCVIKPGSTFQDGYSMEECFLHRWRMTKIIRPSLLHLFENTYKIREMYLWKNLGDGCVIPNIEDGYIINNAGWHFSNLGSPDSIYKKFFAFSHSDDFARNYSLSPELISARKDDLRDPLGRNVSFIKTDLDVPPYILSNKERYEELILG